MPPPSAVVQVPQDPAGVQEETTGVGGSDDEGDDDIEEEEDEQGEEEESEEAAIARATELVKKHRTIKQQSGAVGLLCNDAAAKAIVELEQELVAEKITNVAELKAALNLNDGDKLTATLVRNMIKEKKRDAYDAALPSSKRARLEMSSQDYDPFVTEDDDTKDPDHHGNSNDKNIDEMNLKELEELLTKKTTDLKMMEKEKADNPVVVVMKEFAEHTLPEKEEEAKQVLVKVRVVLKDAWFTSCSPAELRLISQLAEATARKKELQPLIDIASKEVLEIKAKYGEKLASDKLAKVEKKAAGKVAASSSSSRKRH
eukprot:5151391-Prymnesium_polylepis.1